MASFPPRSVDKIIFDGGTGDDTFETPAGVVKLPAVGAQPNIEFFGGPGFDTLVGNSDPEWFAGGPGGDKEDGRAGDDVLISGPVIPGQVDGQATFDGGPGNDSLSGGPLSSTLIGGPGRDTITGGSGNDTIDGGGGNDWIDGGGGDDSISGGAGDDIIFGGPGSDVISGGDGDDTINTGPSGPLSTWPPQDEGDWPTVPQGTYFEIATGGDGADIIDASQATGKVYAEGGDGSDTLQGGSADDDLNGGGGIDWLYGSGGNDLLDGAGGDDFIWGDGGADTIYGGSDNDYVEGGDGPDTIAGGANDDVIWSGSTAALAGPADQPYNGVLPYPEAYPAPDLLGAGSGGCDKVDGVDVNNCASMRRPTLFDGSTSMNLGTPPLNVQAPDGWDGFTFVLASGTTWGQLTFNSDGSWTYTAAPDGAYIDEFSYYATDLGGELTSNIANFTIKVGDWDIGPPIFGYTVPQPQGVNLPQLVVPAPGLLDGLEGKDAVEVVSDTDHGTLDWNEDGSFTLLIPQLDMSRQYKLLTSPLRTPTLARLAILTRRK